MPPVTQERPLRSELFSIELLQQHARQLATEHQTGVPRKYNRLLPRLAANEKLLRAYNKETLRVETTRRITPAAEWLSDNFFLIEEQIRTTRRHLPKGFNRELPHLIRGNGANLPRVYHLAVELIAHVDGRIDAAHLSAFIAAYQETAPLRLGELWAIPIMLRLALIENLRRIAVLLNASRADRDVADEWADRLIAAAEHEPARLVVIVACLAQAEVPLSESFVTEFWQRIHQKSSALKLALNWLEERLASDALTVEGLIQSENHNQAANQVSVGNTINSLRFLDAMNWRKFVETLSLVEQTLRTDPAGVYGEMDFATRDSYRHVVEAVARQSRLTETEVALRAIELARQPQETPDYRRAHVGYYLVDQGRAQLEESIKASIPIRLVVSRLSRKFPLAVYLGAILGISIFWGFGFYDLLASLEPLPWVSILMVAFIVLGASQLAVAVVNWLATVLIKPRLLPKLDFSEGVPTEHCTLVVVPTMLTSRPGIESLLESLEVRYLANRDANVYFGLLTDWRDAEAERLPGDEALVQQVRLGIEALNEKYRSDRPGIFHLFHRPRRWNSQDRIWMGYERKRGKLADLNRLLRGGDPRCFAEITGDLSALPPIKYVLTLDTDTQLPRDAVRQLAGTMAHPLNRPRYNPTQGRVVEGYGILQPRVSISLPGASRSQFAKLYSGETGIDPYTRAVSDVYQDVFREGSFIGKGIYDVDAFEAALKGRFPENRILSHDLIEGCYARSALVSDVQLFEEFPAHFGADVRRRHRWMRGDWQIAAWLLPHVPGVDSWWVANPLSKLSRWKILDNLRRSLVPVALLGLLLLGWSVLPALGVWWSGFVAAVIFLPGLLSLWMEMMIKPAELTVWRHLRNHCPAVGRHLGQGFLTLIFLPFEALNSLDVALRTVGRLLFTKRNLLEWQTASDTEQTSRTGWKNQWLSMWPVCALTLAITLWLLLKSSPSLPSALPFLLLWFSAPAVAWWISQPLDDTPHPLNEAQKSSLRILARKTWRYFETFVTAEENWLPPDNFQEHPRAVIASRTSPTNIGMSLISTLAAWDFGHLSTRQLMDRVKQTLKTVAGLQRYQGHFYNWYHTRTLEPLLPLYVSTVDNGNLAGLLFTLREGLLEVAAKPFPTSTLLSGLDDTLGCWMDTLRNLDSSEDEQHLTQLKRLKAKLSKPPCSFSGIISLLEEIAADPAVTEAHQMNGEYDEWRHLFGELCREHRDEILSTYPWLAKEMNVGESENNGFASFTKDFEREPSVAKLQAEIVRVEELIATRSLSRNSLPKAAPLLLMRQALLHALRDARERTATLEQLARQCDEIARMDFTFLYDTGRKLFSIGYNVTHHRLDGSHYDLLASEARLTSFVAIALGQVPQEHWFALGRLLTSVGNTRALLSWSGSMFEYLMPPLVMPSYSRTLLDISCRSAITRQIEYGEQRNVPWGISESGYNLTDAQSNYQYRAFGVPGLGFKRGLAEDLVIAPYATIIALIISPQEAWENIKRLQAEGAEGRYGLFEALDFTPSRFPRGETRAVVRSFMAHHQGMSLLALASCLLGQPMQRRFRANPSFLAAELLLQERVPKETSVLFPNELEASNAQHATSATNVPFRIFNKPNDGPPEVHLLSNGRYHVMISSAGGGYSLCNNVALTRWREDPTRDCWGAFIYLRDRASGQAWSAAHQPVQSPADRYEAIFSQGRAEFRTRQKEIDSHVEIAVSPEDDIEVRRVTLTNHSEVPRTIEVTSYAEVALNSPAADQAHPAFSKLFVQTEILRERHAILCLRRPRARGEQPPLMFHLMLLHGKEAGQISFETDRAQFLGRGRDAMAPAAMDGPPLSNSHGAVLDPAVAIRRALRLEPKQAARAILITGSSPTREAALALIQKYQDHSMADRVFELAWTHGLVTLRHLNITEQQAQLFGRLAGPLLYSQPIRRADASILQQNRRSQPGLWSFGISGDLPIVLLRCSSMERIDLVREVLAAHAFWRLKGLAVDLVVLNEEDSVYRQSIHDQIISLIASGIEGHLLEKPGGIFVRRMDQLSHEDHILLQTCARVVLSDQDGSLPDQLRRQMRTNAVLPTLVPIRSHHRPASRLESPKRELMFFNGLGGFAPDGREYVILLAPDKTTPAPWVNVIGNPNFGTLVSESGSSYTWAENCHEYRLTPWDNDPVSDASGEAIYIRDEQSGRFWSPTPRPARSQASCVVRHGFGYSVFELVEDGIASEMWTYVAADAPVKFVRVVLRNQSTHERSLSVTGYWEWVLGETRHKNAMHVSTEFDSRTGALLARNTYNADFAGRVAFVATTETIHSFTADRTEFIGRNGALLHPAAMSGTRLSSRTGIGLDPCAALRVNFVLQPGEQREIVFKLGAARDRDEAQSLLERFKRADACRDAIYMVRAFWNDALTATQVETPDPALNLLANGWLLYQTISARLFARTGFYQSGGAFGFRDQLQDATALIHARPQLLREQLLRAAGHQFREGDVQHWWHPPGMRGVRTHFSDDYLWLPYATCRYVEAIGDTGVLDEKIPFLESRPLRADEEAVYDTPIVSNERISLYDHCVSAIRRGLRFGRHGLPLMGCGDWNDGMNLVGEHGKGESVWLAFFLCDVLKHFSELARKRGDHPFADHCALQLKKLGENIESHAWDGGWYRRAYFDNGEPLGSINNPECQIDGLPQSWAALTGIGDPRRAHLAMNAVDRRLVRRDARLIQLFDPPFDNSSLEPGYIKGYLPGVRENGGQYTHGAIWTVMGFAALGDAWRAWELFNLINPIRHTDSPVAVARYKVEPYVVAADVYSVAPHTGRGGWTWYTGSAGWLYRLITESLLGLKLDVDRLRFAPCLPAAWPSYKLRYRYRETYYQITLLNSRGCWFGGQTIVVDGTQQLEPRVILVDDRREHTVEITFN